MFGDLVPLGPVPHASDRNGHPAGDARYRPRPAGRTRVTPTSDGLLSGVVAPVVEARRG